MPTSVLKGAVPAHFNQAVLEAIPERSCQDSRHSEDEAATFTEPIHPCPNVNASALNSTRSTQYTFAKNKTAVKNPT